MKKPIAERQQSEMMDNASLRRQSNSLVRRMESDVVKIDVMLAKLRENSCELASNVDCLTRVIGVGP